MSRLRRNAALIENPYRGGAAYTSSKAARGFIRRGLAVSVGPNAIRFVEQGRRTLEGPGVDGTFQWRRGITGGMVQMLGSTVSKTH